MTRPVIGLLQKKNVGVQEEKCRSAGRNYQTGIYNWAAPEEKSPNIFLNI